MKKLIAAVVLFLTLANGQAAQEEKRKRVVLPNSKLLRCKSFGCFQLWSESPSEANAVFPKQVTLDMDGGCLYGFTALYEKSVALDEVKAAIDERYGKWALSQFANSPVKLWRVEPDKFAIQLSVADKQDEKMNIADAGTKRAIFLAFGGRKSACDLH
jgi:hypothetical protein